ncbi:MAG: hypothetical protein ACT7A5_15920 [Ferrovibrionaceae bacterium]
MADQISSVFCHGCAAVFRRLAEEGIVEIIDPRDFPKGAPVVNDKGRPVIFAVRGDSTDLEAVDRDHAKARERVH